MSIYNLTNDFIQVMELIENGAEGLEDTLESIELATDEKLENMAKLIRNLESEKEGLKAEERFLKTEEKRLSDKRRTIENSIKRIKQHAEYNMRATDKRKIKVGTFTFNIQKNAPSVKIYDEGIIPKRFFKQPDPVLSKKELKDALKNGEVPGAELAQTEGVRLK